MEHGRSSCQYCLFDEDLERILERIHSKAQHIDSLGKSAIILAKVDDIGLSKLMAL